MLLETYIFDFAGTAAVAEALERAAARGVSVRVVVDGIGTGECRHRGRRAGRRPACTGASSTRPAAGASSCPRWRRMHRKLCVVDGQFAFCGGINLIDDYLDPTYGALEEPRFDFAVRVSGPLVADATRR